MSSHSKDLDIYVEHSSSFISVGPVEVLSVLCANRLERHVSTAYYGRCTLPPLGTIQHRLHPSGAVKVTGAWSGVLDANSYKLFLQCWSRSPGGLKSDPP